MMQKQNLRIILIGGGIFFTCMIASTMFLSTQTEKPEILLSQTENRKNRDMKVVFDAATVDDQFWRTVNLTKENIPSSVKDATSGVVVKPHTVNIMSVETYYQEALPPAAAVKSGEVVVLLHGAAFKSSTWVNLGTLHILAAMGHRVVALDLPGYGNTRGSISQANRGKYLSNVINALAIQSAILVSPSMSGTFSIPYMITENRNIGGYIPVAPVGSSQIVSYASQIKVPTLIIYGEKDKSLGYKSRDDLINIPTSQAVELPNAAHPAYLDQPDLFHKLLYNFIKQVQLHKSV